MLLKKVMKIIQDIHSRSFGPEKTYVHISKAIFNTDLKFIYSEKATKFCEIFTLLLTTVHTVKSKMKISQIL